MRGDRESSDSGMSDRTGRAAQRETLTTQDFRFQKISKRSSDYFRFIFAGMTSTSAGSLKFKPAVEAYSPAFAICKAPFTSAL